MKVSLVYIEFADNLCAFVQAAGKFDVEVVQRQLRYTGMLATVQIRQAGYNYRLTFEVFTKHFKTLSTSNRIRRWSVRSTVEH